MATLTLRGYAKHRRAAGIVGGTLKAVQKAIARGWISVEPDGRIEPAEADRRWAQLHSPKVYVTHTTRATPAATPDGEDLPPVVAAYLRVIEQLNMIYESNHICLAQAAALKGAGAPGTGECWRTLWQEWDALKTELPAFQQELFDVAVLVEQIQGQTRR